MRHSRDGPFRRVTGAARWRGGAGGRLRVAVGTRAPDGRVDGDCVHRGRRRCRRPVRRLWGGCARRSTRAAQPRHTVGTAGIPTLGAVTEPSPAPERTPMPEYDQPAYNQPAYDQPTYDRSALRAADPSWPPAPAVKRGVSARVTAAIAAGAFLIG